MRGSISRLELLARETADQELGERLLEQVGQHRSQLAACQKQFRQANVKAMTGLESASTRELLGQAGPGVRRRQQGGADKEALAAEHSQVTSNLLAISRQLAETVERSKQTVGSLESSSKTVEELQEEHKMMGGVIGQSRRLITKYGRREFTDKVLIIFALAFFFAVVLYILRKRLFPTYGPIEVVLYMLGFTGNVFSSITSLWS